MKTKILIIFLFFLNVSFVFSNPFVNVRSFGAKGDGISDDTEAFQKCLDESISSKCIVPKGHYIITKNIYFNSNNELIGEGDESYLEFKGGGIKGKKNGSNQFFYTNNYNNEVVPNNSQIYTLNDSSKGSSRIKLKNGNIFKVNDEIVLFNNILNSWDIFENSKMSNVWNSDELGKFASGGGFKVKSIGKDYIILDKPLPFFLKANSVVSKRSGISSSKIKNLKISTQSDSYCLQFEQPNGLILENLNLKGTGGIKLSFYAKNCKIENNIIESNQEYGICIENFSSNNLINNNKIIFKKINTDKGGDASVLLLMGCFENVISNNLLVNQGSREKNFGGIFAHALCFNNKVENNNIKGAAEALGVYYGAFNNLFIKNNVSDSKIGLFSYYSRGNEFSKNLININYDTKTNTYGISDFSSINNSYSANVFTGNMIFGANFQSSKPIKFDLNKFTQGVNTYSVGLNNINSTLNKTKLNNSYNGFKVQNLTK